MGLEFEGVGDRFRFSRVRELSSAMYDGLYSTFRGVCVGMVYEFGCEGLVDVLRHFVMLYPAPGFIVTHLNNKLEIADRYDRSLCVVDLSQLKFDGECNGFNKLEKIEEVVMRYADALYTLLVFLIERLGHVADRDVVDDWTSSAVMLVELGAKMDPELYGKLDRLANVLKVRLFEVKSPPPRKIKEDQFCLDAIWDFDVMFDHSHYANYALVRVIDTAVPRVAVELRYIEKKDNRYTTVEPRYVKPAESTPVDIDIDRVEELTKSVKDILEAIANKGSECSNLAKAWLELLENARLVEEVP